MALLFVPEDLAKVTAPRQRAAIRCRLDGMSLDETAEELDCSVQAVKNMLRRAGQLLGKVDGRRRSNDTTRADRKEFSERDIALLTPTEARIVRLRKDLGLNDREISNRLGIRMSSTGSMLTKARRRLGRKTSNKKRRRLPPVRYPAVARPMAPLRVEDFISAGASNLGVAAGSQGSRGAYRPKAAKQAERSA